MFKKTLFFLCVMILSTAAMLQASYAGSLKLALNVKEINDLGNDIYIDLGGDLSVCGNLTLDGSPVTDGLAAIQIDDPQDGLFILRTLTTGGTPQGPWPVEILELITVNMAGDPESDFEVGGYVGLKISIRNNGLSIQHVMVIVNLYYSDGLPFLAWKFYEEDMMPESTETKTVHLPIPDDAHIGQASVYASAIEDWPKNGGYAFSPEKSATFNIVGFGGSATYSPQGFHDMNGPGEYNLTFCTNGYGGLIGNYTVSAVSLYGFYFVTNQTTFEVYLLGDVNDDGKIRVNDVLAVASAFGTNEGGPGWDPRCDLTHDGKVRVNDVLIVAQAFGKSCGNPPNHNS